MRVVIAVEDHFHIVEGNAYSSYLDFDSFWQRYLSVFDSVLIIARATEVSQVTDSQKIVTKDGVTLSALPRYHGPYQYLSKMRQIHKTISDNVRKGDAYILRVSGNIGTQLWRHLPKGYPFGVEVMSDPYSVFAPGSVKSIFRPFYRWRWTQNLALQCRQAVAAAYVTEHVLQRRYPPGKNAFATHYSTINLDKSTLCNDVPDRIERIKSIPERLKGNGEPVRLGFVGSFSQGHKLPHIHIEALAKCIAKGANVSLEMIGDGALLGKMKKLAAELGVDKRISFRGRIPGGKCILDAMKNFDLFVSATAAEGLPRVIIEAMSQGCPCIASNVGGTGEILEEKFLVPPGNANALADLVLEILSNTDTMIKASMQNVSVAARFCTDVLTPRREKFYCGLRRRTEEYLIGLD